MSREPVADGPRHLHEIKYPSKTSRQLHRTAPLPPATPRPVSTPARGRWIDIAPRMQHVAWDGAAGQLSLGWTICPSKFTNTVNAMENKLCTFALRVAMIVRVSGHVAKT
ncbi:unnamed protein product, partial [Iphiclides podalirius]